MSSLNARNVFHNDLRFFHLKLIGRKLCEGMKRDSGKESTDRHSLTYILLKGKRRR